MQLNVNPQETVLLVMDYQPGIIGRLPEGDAASLLQRASRAIETARGAGAHVGYVRVALDETEAASVPPRNKMFARIAQMGGAFSSDAPATQIDARVAPQTGDLCVRKRRVGAFSTTDLDAQLRERGISHLVLAGISSSGVVLSTVRDAADRDYGLTVLSDACADPDPSVHAFLMEKIFPNQADVVTVDRLGSLFG